jgi:hypothetical protein
VKSEGGTTRATDASNEIPSSYIWRAPQHGSHPRGPDCDEHASTVPSSGSLLGIAQSQRITIQRHRPRSTSTSLHVSPDPSAASPARYQRSGISDFPCSNTMGRNIGEKLVSYAVTLSEVVDVIHSLAPWPDPPFSMDRSISSS